MRITEILTESQLQQLEEGPKWDAFGRGVGKFAGGLARGAGAVAGGVRGAFTALKKGYDSGKAVVGDDPDPGAGKPGYTAPTPAPEPSTTTPPSAADINAQGPEGSAPAKPQTGAAGAALAKTDAVTDKQTSIKAGETVYAQVKANIDKLDKKGKTRILNLLQKSIQQTPSKPTAGAGAFGQMAQQLAGGKPPNTMANAPVSASNTADPGNPNQAAAAPTAAAPTAALDPRDLNKDGKVDATEKSIARNKSKTGADATATAPAGQGAFANVAQQLAKPTDDKLTPQQVADKKAELLAAKANRATTNQTGFKTSIKQSKEKGIATASLVHHGFSLNEVFAYKLEMHKRRMFESALANGTASVFVK